MPAARPDWDTYMMNLSKDIGMRSTCLRRHYGAVIVDKDNRIVATGYNGAARGRLDCLQKGICWREAHLIPHGQQYEKCVAVHAEANAIINCDPKYFDGKSRIYIYGVDAQGKQVDSRPCLMCSRMIDNARLVPIWWHEKADGSFELVKGNLVEDEA